MNQIMLISAYVHGGQWVFDDADRDLVKEPFVCGADLVIDRLCLKAGLPEPVRREGNQATLLFSAGPFPGASRLRLLRPEAGGNWYKSEEFGIEGWLCPAMFRFFAETPPEIYAIAKPPGEA